MWANPTTPEEMRICLKKHGDRPQTISSGGSIGFIYTCWTVQPPSVKYMTRTNLMRLEEKLLTKDYGRFVTVINIEEIKL